MSGALAVVPGMQARDKLDAIGFVAFAIPPTVALYQGIVSTFGFPPMSETTATLVPLVVIAACLAARIPSFGQRFSTPSIRRATFYLIAYFVVVLGSTLLAYVEPFERDPVKMLQQLATTAGAAAVFLVAVSAPSLSAAMRSLRLSVYLWAVAAILTPLTALTPFPIGEVQGIYEGSQGARAFGVLGDSGTFVVSFLAVAFFMSRKFVWFTLAILALILSGSRTPLVVAAAGIAAAMVLATPAGGVQNRGSRAFRVLVAAVAAGFLLVAIQIAFGLISQKLGFFNAFERLSETQFSDTDRFFSIEQGIEWFGLSPVYGNGFNSYFYFSLRSAAFGANQGNALNQIVQTLVDGGVLGLIFLVLFFFEAVRPGRGWLVDRRYDPFGLRVWLLVFLVLNQTAVYVLPAFYLTIFIFAVCGIALHARETAALAAHRGVALARAAPVPGR